MRHGGSSVTRAVAGFVWVLVALITLFISAVLHLGHPAARRMMGRAVEAAVASGSPGVLRIGHIDEASLDRLALREVEYWDLEDRRKVLELPDVEVTMEPSSLWSDEVHILSVRVEGGQMTFQKPWRRPSEGFMARFNAPKELTREGRQVRVDEIAFHDVEVRGIVDATEYRLQGLHGNASMRVDDHVRFEVAGAEGTLVLPGGRTALLTNVDVWLPPDPEGDVVVRAQGDAVFQAEALRAELTYFDREAPSPLILRLEQDAWSSKGLAVVGLPEPPDATPPYAGTVVAEGTFRSVHLRPELTDAEGVQVETEEPPLLESGYDLGPGDELPPELTSDLSGPLLLFVFLTVLLASLVILQVALMVWLLRRGEGQPWWRMLPVATSVAAWMAGARVGPAAFWGLLAVYLALVLGAA
jgi:hypothetical protein